MTSRSVQLKRLKELRETGAKRLSEYIVNEEDARIFDNVSEAEYNAIALRNLREDNFIVDDNGEGYVDNGLEDWDNMSQGSESSAEEEEREAKSNLFTLMSLGKRKKKNEKNSVQNLLAKQTAQVRPVKEHHNNKKPVNEEADKALMDNIFDALDNDYTKVEESIKKRKVSDIPIRRKKAVTQSYIVENVSQEVTHDVHESLEIPKIPVDTPVVVDAPTVLNFEHVPLKTSAIKISKNARKASSFLPKFEKEEVEAKQMDILKPLTKNNYQDWREIQKKLSENNSSVHGAPLENDVAQKDFLESDGSLNLFWIDAFEKKGRVFLFGKVETICYFYRLQSSLHHPNSILVVAWSLRILSEMSLFCRGKKCLTVILIMSMIEFKNETDREVSISDVYQEIDALRKAHDIKEFDSCCVSRKYAFEIPGIPSESDYLKVVYSFDGMVLDTDL